MTRPIDEKLVVMKMDNSDFKKKAVDTTTIFGKMTESLNKIPGVNLGKTARDLNDINRAAGNNNLDRLASAVETVASRFSNLGVVATTALANITNKAVNAGMALSKSLSTDQVKDGFREYETKIGAIQTMLSNTKWAGTTLDDVKKTLGELNDYADQTIYSFSQMTQNIGRFTASGANLEDSATAIKGLGNLAAVSGSTSDQLNTAMYQMSQALQNPYLMLQDWNSLQNAGMAGKMTQDALMDTAESMGIVVDRTKAFRLSLESGWLTSKVFLETMKKFGKDQSMIDAATKVRTLTQMISTVKEGIGSGWAETWENIFGDFDEATKLWTGLSDAIKSFFDGKAKKRNAFVKDLADAGAFNNIFQGLKSAVTGIAQLFGAIGEGFRLAFPPASFVKITALTVQFRAFTAGLMMSGDTIKNVTTVFHGIFSVFAAVGKVIGVIIGALVSLIPNFGSVGGGVLDLAARFAQLIINFNDSAKFAKVLATTSKVLKGVFSSIAVAVGFLVIGFTNLIDTVSEVWSVLSKGVSTGKGPWDKDSIIVDWLLSVRDAFKSFGDTLSNLDISMESIGKMFDSFFGVIKSAWNGLKEALFGIDDLFKSLFKGIAENQGWILAGGGVAGMVAIGVQIWRFFSGFNSIGKQFAEVLEGAANVLGTFQNSIRANMLMTIAIAVGILAVSLKLLQGVKMEEVAPALYGIIIALSAVTGALYAISKYELDGGGMKGALALIGMATAVALMAGAIKKMSGMEYGEITRGLYGIVVLMGAMAGAIALMGKFGGKTGTSSLQFVAMAASIHIMVSAIENILKIKPSELSRGMNIIAILLTEMALISKITQGSGMAAGASMLLMAAALTALIIPIEILGRMDPAKLAIGLGTLTVALAVMVGALALMAPEALPAAGAMAIVALAMNMLIVPMTAFSLLPWEGIMKGMVGIVGAITALGLASMLLIPALIPMVAASVAITLLGLGAMAAGAGMALFGKGLLTLATLGTGAVATIIATIGAFILGFATLLPAITDLMSKITNAIIEVMNRNIPKIVDSFMRLIISIRNAITKRLPEFIQSGVDLILAYKQGMMDRKIELITAGMEMIIEFVTALADAVETNGPEITNAVMRLIGNILLVVVDAGLRLREAFFGWIPGVKESTAKLAKEAEKNIKETFSAKEIGGIKATDYAKGLLAKKNDVKKSGETLAKAGEEGTKSVDATDSGEYFGDGFAKGISSKEGKVEGASFSLANIAKTALAGMLQIHSPSLVAHRLGEWYSVGFSKGIDAKQPDVQKSSEDIAKTAEKSLTKGAKGAGKSAADAARDAFHDAMDEADYKLEIGKINSTQYIAELEKIKKAYSKYPDLVREVSLEIKKAEDDSIKDREEAEKKLFDKRKQLIDDRKYYETITLQQELEAWQRMAKKYKEGSEQRKEIDREVYRVKKELIRKEEEDERNLFEKHKQLLQDRKDMGDLSLMQELEAWKREAKKYKEGTDERKEADKEVYRVKKEINDKIIALNDEYTQKIEDANQRLIDGERQLTEEYERAVDDRARSISGFAGLFSKVGEKSKVTGKELMDNLSGQVGALSQWMIDIQQLSNRGIDQGLLEELRQMGPNAAGEIAALTTMTDAELSQYSELWSTKNGLARFEAVNELDGLNQDTQTKIQELRDQTAIELEAYKTEWIGKVKEIRFGVEQEILPMTATMTQIGKDTISGLMEGMGSMQGPLVDAAKKIANSVAATIKSTLKIKSPSRVLMGLGKYAGEGLGVGLRKSASFVKDGAKGLATTAKDSLNKFLDGFDMPVDDNELHFKAVIDYDRFDTSRFGFTSIPDLSFTNGMASATRSTIRQNGSKTPTVDTSTSGTQQVDNGPKQPIIFQSVLNGRVIAEETFNDTNQLFNSQTNLDSAMKGV